MKVPPYATAAGHACTACSPMLPLSHLLGCETCCRWEGGGASAGQDAFPENGIILQEHWDFRGYHRLLPGTGRQWWRTPGESRTAFLTLAGFAQEFCLACLDVQ